MSVTRERYDQGQSWDEYLAGFTIPSIPWKQNFEKLELEPDVKAWLDQRDRPLHILCTTEEWCGDARAYVPAVARIAADYPQLDLKIFLRDKNLDITDQYLKDGEHRAIPVFVVFDENFQEKGHFIERPAAVTEFMAKARAEWAAAHPEFPDADKGLGEMSEETRKAYIAQSRQWNAENGNAWANQTLREVLALADAQA